jgi:hypothetical protein
VQRGAEGCRKEHTTEATIVGNAPLSSASSCSRPDALSPDDAWEGDRPPGSSLPTATSQRSTGTVTTADAS